MMSNKTNKIAALATKYKDSPTNRTDEDVFLRRFDPDLIAMIRQLARPYSFVANEGRYYEYNRTVGWIKTGVSPLRNSNPILHGAGNWKLFNALIAFEGRSYKSTISTFKPVDDPTLLNLIRQDGWLVPTDGECDPGFKVISDLIGSVVMAAIATKFSRPDKSQPPIILFSESGEAVPEYLTVLLHTIFNSCNKTVSLLSNRTGLDDVIYDPNRTALYIVKMINRAAVDYYRSAAGTKAIYVKGDSCPITQPDLIGLCGNPVEVAKFLNRIIKRFPQKPCPQHCAAFSILLHSNKTATDEFCRWLIHVNRTVYKWTYCSYPDLWTVFCLYRDTLKLSALDPINRAGLRVAIKEFFDTNYTPFTWRDSNRTLSRTLIGPSGKHSTFDGLGLRGVCQFKYQESLIIVEKNLTTVLLRKSQSSLIGPGLDDNGTDGDDSNRISVQTQDRLSSDP